MHASKAIELTATAPVAAESMGSILVAEDSALFRHLIRQHVTEWGFDLVCVNDG